MANNMNILHYFLGFPPIHDGGLMIYAKDLAKEQLTLGHNVIMLMPGLYINNTSKSAIKFYKREEGLPIYQIINSQPVSFSGVINPKEFTKEKSINNYCHFLKEYGIEILHVHSLIGFPKELLDEAKKLNIKTIFTTHDYFGLCPKINFFKYNNTICNDYKEGKECFLCNYVELNKLRQLYIKRNLKIIINRNFFLNSTVRSLSSLLHRRKNLIHGEDIDYKKITIDWDKAIEYVKFRNYYKNIIESFDIILFNSSVTKKQFAQYINLDNIRHEILHITRSKIKDNRNIIKYNPKINNKVNFLFMGYLDKKKGFWDLVSVLNEIKDKYTNWQINIYGDYSNVDLSKFDNNFFKFYGKYRYSDLPDMFSNSSILIIPSKWKETFGFIGLEAYSYGIPVLVSENVGFSDLIKDGINGLVYSDDDKNQNLKEKIIELLESPEILLQLHSGILNGNFNYSLIKHAKIILDIYTKLREGSNNENWDINI